MPRSFCFLCEPKTTHGRQKLPAKKITKKKAKIRAKTGTSLCVEICVLREFCVNLSKKKQLKMLIFRTSRSITYRAVYFFHIIVYLLHFYTSLVMANTEVKPPPGPRSAKYGRLNMGDLINFFHFFPIQ